MLQAILAALQPPQRPRARRRVAKRRDVHLEVLKALKSHELARRQIEQELGFAEMTVHRACAELHALGFLVKREADDDTIRKGRRPMLFTVAPTWGGKAKP